MGPRCSLFALQRNSLHHRDRVLGSLSPERSDSLSHPVPSTTNMAVEEHLSTPPPGRHTGGTRIPKPRKFPFQGNQKTDLVHRLQNPCTDRQPAGGSRRKGNRRSLKAAPGPSTPPRDEGFTPKQREQGREARGRGALGLGLVQTGREQGCRG